MYYVNAVQLFPNPSRWLKADGGGGCRLHLVRHDRVSALATDLFLLVEEAPEHDDDGHHQRSASRQGNTDRMNAFKMCPLVLTKRHLWPPLCSSPSYLQSSLKYKICGLFATYCPNPQQGKFHKCMKRTFISILKSEVG